jgi:uncharacterized protein (DUF1778 family)
MALKPNESKSKCSRTKRLELRITLGQKDFLARAAASLGRSLTDFVVTSAGETAARTVKEHESMIFSDRDRKFFIRALLNPPAPGARLRNAARYYRQHFGE